MIKLKCSKGITMVSLVITIAVMCILAGVGIIGGIVGINQTKDSKLTSELTMVQHAVLEQYVKYKTTKDSIYLVGNKITKEQANAIAIDIGVMLENIPDTYTNKDYYILDKASLTEIGIEDSEDQYLINYVSGEVINMTQKRLSNDDPLYMRANNF